jgi:branched-chain amino acid transport system substrate-binding protein
MVGLICIVLIGTLTVQAHAQTPLRIGGSMAISGRYSALGQNALRGAKLCVKQTNNEGGLLGREVELAVQDDESQPAKAASIYRKLLAEDKVDAILSPYSSPITAAVADVLDEHRVVLVACCAATSSIFRKRKYLFQFTSPAEGYLRGLVDIAAKHGLKTLAVIHQDAVFPKATARGAVEFAKKKGMQVVLTEAYDKGTTDFRPLLTRIRTMNPDVLAAATYFEDAVAISRQLKETDVSPKMFGVTVGGDLPKFHTTLGSTAEYVYVPTKWVPDLVTMRAGGLVPVARQYPGARELVEAHHKEFPGAGLSYQTVEGYGACRVLTEAIRRSGSLDADRIRDVLLKININTAFGAFKVDADGVQIGHKILMFQWQDGKKAMVWPEDFASDQPRLPTPPWSKR